MNRLATLLVLSNDDIIIVFLVIFVLTSLVYIQYSRIFSSPNENVCNNLYLICTVCVRRSVYYFVQFVVRLSFLLSIMREQKSSIQHTIDNSLSPTISYDVLTTPAFTKQGIGIL